MGYYSKFSLTLKESDGKTLITDDEIVEKIVEDLRIISGYKYLFENLEIECNGFGFNPEYYDSYTEDCKWYDWEYDLEFVSKSFPEIYFIVIRNGEEEGDLQRISVKNGKTLLHQKGIIKYEWH